MDILSVLLVLCDGNLRESGRFPSQMSCKWSFCIFFIVILNKLLNQQMICLWFEMPLFALATDTK